MPLFEPSNYLFYSIFLDGVNGVFDTEDLVELLRLENCVDICVINIPSSVNVS